MRSDSRSIFSEAPSDRANLDARALGRAILETLRPYQWVKNALVFVPLAAAHRLNDGYLLSQALRTFVAFCLCASSMYVVNDVLDASVDRQHPHKCHRPIASGRLPVRIALSLVPVLLVAAAVTALPLDRRAGACLAVYTSVMSVYAWRLRAIVLLDALTLAFGYALRVMAGGFAVHIMPSTWLLAFCTFLFFSLALIKRYAEIALLRARDGGLAHARAYLSQDQELIVALGSACGVVSVLVLALYMSTGHAGRHYSRPDFIWMSCILLLYWISHMWLIAHRGRMTDDPLVFALKDRVSQLLIVLMGASAWLAV